MRFMWRLGQIMHINSANACQRVPAHYFGVLSFQYTRGKPDDSPPLDTPREGANEEMQRSFLKPPGPQEINSWRAPKLSIHFSTSNRNFSKSFLVGEASTTFCLLILGPETHYFSRMSVPSSDFQSSCSYQAQTYLPVTLTCVVVDGIVIKSNVRMENWILLPLSFCESSLFLVHKTGVVITSSDYFTPLRGGLIVTTLASKVLRNLRGYLLAFGTTHNICTLFSTWPSLYLSLF